MQFKLYNDSSNKMLYRDINNSELKSQHYLNAQVKILQK